MSITKQTWTAGAEVGAALVVTIALGAALKDAGGPAFAIPLLVVVAYWMGKMRQSGQGWSYFQVEVVDTPLERDVVAAVPASGEVSNVIRPPRWGKPENWNPCRACNTNFTSSADLLKHELDAHGDDFFRGLEAA